ncbi:transcriptional regulator [Enterococcus florum]|uniref:Transcriptional regulator n=1 Tax=Enterococcus florum TaxID=2480627 RepID=A0A4P5PGY9_9ENTE|nr:helix-turn-helix domain-containing protein [Enterococcus florum]GCF95691.1 transcriptional regulator [Enterococcus florum]
MSSILFLTKNVLGEQEWQERLYRLNQEVFFSSNLVHKILFEEDDLSILKCFSIVILSHTITNDEAQRLVAALKNKRVAVLRVCDSEGSEGELRRYQTKGYKGILCLKGTLSELRERLSQLNLEQQQTKVIHFQTREKQRTQEIDYHLRFEKGLSILSPMERQLLKVLLKQGQKTTTREALCQLLWSECSSKNSQLASLSNMVSNIRTKFLRAGILETMVNTDWGAGYSLSEDFYKEYQNNEKLQRLIALHA